MFQGFIPFSLLNDDTWKSTQQFWWFPVSKEVNFISRHRFPFIVVLLCCNICWARKRDSIACNFSVMVTTWWPRRNDKSNIQTDFQMSELMNSTVLSRTLKFPHVFVKQYSKYVGQNMPQHVHFIAASHKRNRYERKFVRPKPVRRKIHICECNIDSFTRNLFNSMWITNGSCIVFAWVRHVVWIVSEIGYHCNSSNFDMGLHLKFALFTYSKRIVEFHGEGMCRCFSGATPNDYGRVSGIRKCSDLNMLGAEKHSTFHGSKPFHCSYYNICFMLLLWIMHAKCERSTALMPGA